jgi:hypothetical protein
MTPRPRHGHAARGRRSPEYTAWANMLRRCNNPQHPQFKNYGGRGVEVHPRWREFDNFLADMGPRPAGMSLERKENDRGYEPGNCVWATQRQQMNNTRITTIVELNGVSKPLSMWCDELKMNKSTVRKRVARDGWSWERALLTPTYYEG